MKAVPLDEAVLCTVVEAELRFGAEKSDDPARNLLSLEEFVARFVILPFDSAAAREYGRPRAFLQRMGSLLGGNDLMIASIALAHGLTLVTHNVAEFGRVPSLKLEDWEA